MTFHPLRTLGRILSGLGIGAAIMYLFDPTHGRARRGRLLARVQSTALDLDDTVERVAHDLAHRARGRFAVLRANLVEEQVSDDVLTERVRARLGHLVSYPHAIEVAASDGVVVVRGHCPAKEIDRLIGGISDVRGVRAIDCRLGEGHAINPPTN